MLFGNRVVKYCILEDEVLCVLILSLYCPVSSLFLLWVVFVCLFSCRKRVFSILPPVPKWFLIQQWVCILRSINEKIVSDAG